MGGVSDTQTELDKLLYPITINGEVHTAVDKDELKHLFTAMVTNAVGNPGDSKRLRQKIAKL